MSFDALIDGKTLLAHLDEPQWRVIDCRFYLDNPDRGKQEFVQSHIPNAIYAHLDKDLSDKVIPGVTGRHPLPNERSLINLFSRWGITNNTQVVVYDQGNSMIAARLWWMLKRCGHKAVAVLDGGWQCWQGEFPESNQDITIQPQEFHLNPDKTLEVSVQDVIACIDDPHSKLLDARTADRYRGENETIDPVAGHIPSAVSAPFIANIEANGRFKSIESLKSRFESILGSTPASQTIVYCGSGVTAAQNILAMYYAGLGMPKLYVGSWSHWITDPERMVASAEA